MILDPKQGVLEICEAKVKGHLQGRAKPLLLSETYQNFLDLYCDEILISICVIKAVNVYRYQTDMSFQAKDLFTLWPNQLAHVLYIALKDGSDLPDWSYHPLKPTQSFP